MSQKKILFSLIIGTLLVLACAVPAIFSPDPIPTTDANEVRTMVAGTASGKMTQTVEAAVTVSAPIDTAVPTPARPTIGSILTTQPDGTTFFSDAETGVEILIPETWLPLRIDQPEYASALTDPSLEKLGLSQYLTTFRGQDPNQARLLIFDIQEGHQQNLFPATVIVQTGYSLSPEEVQQKEIESDRQKFLDMNVISTGTRTLNSGVTAHTRETTYIAGTISTGDRVKLYTSVIVFAWNGKVTSIQLQTLDELRQISTPQFEVILASLNLFTP